MLNQPNPWDDYTRQAQARKAMEDEQWQDYMRNYLQQVVSGSHRTPSFSASPEEYSRGQGIANNAMTFANMLGYRPGGGVSGGGGNLYSSAQAKQNMDLQSEQ